MMRMLSRLVIKLLETLITLCLGKFKRQPASIVPFMTLAEQYNGNPAVSPGRSRIASHSVRGEAVPSAMSLAF
jgi:hypothetical protein